MATLTHQEMKDVIRAGGSVLHNGTVHTRHDTLPSEADLAVGDERRTAEARDALDRQIAQLAAERAKLEAPQDTPEQTEERRRKQTTANAKVTTDTALDSNNTQPGAR